MRLGKEPGAPPALTQRPVRAPNAIPGDVAFADAAAGDAIDAFIDGLDWEPVVSPLRDEISQVVAGAATLEAAADRLVTVLTSPAGAKVADQIARALLQAGLAGERLLAGAGRADDDGAGGRGVGAGAEDEGDAERQRGRLERHGDDLFSSGSGRRL